MSSFLWTCPLITVTQDINDDKIPSVSTLTRELTRFGIGGIKSDSCVAELLGGRPEVGFSWRMTRWTVPHSEKTCFTPSYIRKPATNALVNSHFSKMTIAEYWLGYTPLPTCHHTMELPSLQVTRNPCCLLTLQGNRAMLQRFFLV